MSAAWAERAGRLLRGLHEDPRQLGTLASRALALVRAHWLLWEAARGRGLLAFGPLTLVNPAAMTLGDRVVLGGGMIPTRLGCGPAGRLVVGDDVVFNYAVHVHAEAEVRIGNRCLLASMVRLVDAATPVPRPIVLEDDVWLAHGVVVEPGVRIGAGSVVSAGSVVVRDVPPRSLAMGRPARSMSLDLVASPRGEQRADLHAVRG